MFSENYIGNICISGIGNSVAGDTVVTRDRTCEDLRRTTQEKILGLLRENPELTRKALATRIGITPDSAKHHLDSLKKQEVFAMLDRLKRAAGKKLNTANN